MSKDRPIKNVPASVRERLYALAKARGEDFSLIVSRYVIERLLFRLSRSPFSEEFILKGAQLFSLWTNVPYRPTRDLDLLRQGDSAIPKLVAIFRKICTLAIEESDGLTFQPKTIRGQEIREGAEYGGVRIKVEYHLAQIKDTLQIDIGLGDAIFPKPQRVAYPSLLGFASARLKAYPKEAVIAEKFHAMVILGLANSRMKDFYDLYKLTLTSNFDGKILQQSLKATFKRRKTELPAGCPPALSREFARDSIKQTQWKAFLRKNRLKEEGMDLVEIVDRIGTFLLPPIEASRQEQTFTQMWTPQRFWKRVRIKRK